MPKRVDFSLNFSVDIPDNVDANEANVYGDFLLHGEGFAMQIRAEEHTLEVCGEEDS